MKYKILLIAFLCIMQIAKASSDIYTIGVISDEETLISTLHHPLVIETNSTEDPQITLSPCLTPYTDVSPSEETSFFPSLLTPVLTLKDLSNLLEGKLLPEIWDGWQFEGLNHLSFWLNGGVIDGDPSHNAMAILNQSFFKGSAEFWNFPLFCLNKKPIKLTLDIIEYKFYEKFADPVQCVGKSGFLFRFFPALLGRPGPDGGIDIIAYRPTLPTDAIVPPDDNFNDLLEYLDSLEGNTILSISDSTRDSVQYWKKYLENLGKKSSLDLSNSHLENKHLFALAVALLGNTTIKKINLAGNSIINIPTILGYDLPHFQEFIISNNPILEWPLELGRNWKMMQHVTANQLMISQLPFDFAVHWPKLRTLHLSYGNLEIATSLIESNYDTFRLHWPYLTQLNLTHNKLSASSQSLLTSLKREFRKRICKISFEDQQIVELEDPTTL